MELPSPELYSILNEKGFEDLLLNFYRRLANSEIAHLFPRDEAELKFASHKSACFFIGLCGGPPLYHQQFGPPRLRARHIPFAIDEKARLIWLQCFDSALNEMIDHGAFPLEYRNDFWNFISGFSTWMVNSQLDQNNDE